MIRLLTALPVLLVASACAQQTPDASPPDASASTPATPASATVPADGDGAPFGVVGYDLARPAMTVELPSTLDEVSGLAWRADDRLAAVYDEDGVVFTLDPETGAILGETRVAGEGDYEAVEVTPDALWVLRSDGTLHERPVGGGASADHRAALPRECDAEGLAYDPGLPGQAAAGDRLLISCKEEPGEGLRRVRAIYAFDLASRTLAPAPVMQLARDAVDGEQNFKPSAMAVHPQTGQLYVLSSVRPALAVLGADGALVALADLPAEIFPQPEGLAFAPDGTMYVTTEADGDVARLARFDPQR